VLKPNAGCKNCFKSTNELLSFQHCFVDLDENTTNHDYPDYRSTINNSGMESFCADSILKLVRVNSKLKSAESPSVDSKVDLSIGYSNLELFLANFRLEFVIEPKIPFASLEKCLLVECQLFDQSLPKFDGLKMPFGSVVIYSSFSMLATNFFWLTPVFNVV
jgi:hypothetical protein